MTILAVDPGPTKSAWMEYDGYVIDCGIEDTCSLYIRVRVCSMDVCQNSHALNAGLGTSTSGLMALSSAVPADR